MVRRVLGVLLAASLAPLACGGDGEGGGVDGQDPGALDAGTAGGSDARPPGCGGGCAGCCDGDACVDGDSSMACGRDGLACQICDGDTPRCVSGACVPPAPCGPATCTGCCDGNLCHPGIADDYCGDGGEPCGECSSPLTCQMATQACGIDAGSLWDVVVIEAHIRDTDETTLQPWDPFWGLPDPYVTVALAGAQGTSAIVADTLTPSWNATLLSGVSYQSLRDSDLSRYLWDDDLIEDTAISFHVGRVPTEWLDGQPHEFVGPPPYGGGWESTLIMKIVPH